MRSVNWDFLSVHLDTSLPSQKWPTLYPSRQSKSSMLSSGGKSGHFFEGMFISLCMTFIFAFHCPQVYNSGYGVEMDFYFTLQIQFEFSFTSFGRSGREGVWHSTVESYLGLFCRVVSVFQTICDRSSFVNQHNSTDLL